MRLNFVRVFLFRQCVCQVTLGKLRSTHGLRVMASWRVPLENLLCKTCHELVLLRLDNMRSEKSVTMRSARGPINHRRSAVAGCDYDTDFETSRLSKLFLIDRQVRLMIFPFPLYLSFFLSLLLSI
jgi:hypothetical protein